jgi:hypothetical protein
MNHYKTTPSSLELHEMSCNPTLGAPYYVNKFVKNMKSYDKATIDEIPKFQEHVFSQFLAYTYLDNADKAKYITLLMGLQTQTSLKTD